MSEYQKVENQTKSASLRNLILQDLLRTDRLDDPKGMQEHLRMEGVDMSLSGIRKGLKKGALMLKGKSR
jgi:hypothetical protein